MSTTHVHHNYLIHMHTVEGLCIFLSARMAFCPFQCTQAVKAQTECTFLHKTFPAVQSLQLLFRVDLGVTAPALTPYSLLLESNSHDYMYLSSPVDGQLCEDRDHHSLTFEPPVPSSLQQVPSIIFIIVNLQ